MSEQPLYLDHNATTPLASEVLDAMLPWLAGRPANAGSRTHWYGQQAKDAVEHARRIVSEQFSAAPEDIVFTSGATESNNLVLLGLAAHGRRAGKTHILSTAIEHKAVLEPLQHLKNHGFEIELAPVTAGGFVEPEEINKRIRKDTLLISAMHANNETGVIQPVEEIAELANRHQVLFHVDAAQTFGKLVPELRALQCDFASISAHKINGPMGVGALLVRNMLKLRRLLTPIYSGGGQERGLRPGTQPTPLIVGLGRAAELASQHHEENASQCRRLKRQLLSDLRTLSPIINGDQTRCLPHVINLAFAGIDSEALMMATRNQLAFSNGSACTSAAYTPSHVLLAMGLDEERIESSVRLSWNSQSVLRGEPLARTVRSLIQMP